MKKLLNQISSKINIKYKIISYKNINLSLEKLLDVKMLITNDNGIANFAANFGIKCNIIVDQVYRTQYKIIKMLI